MNRNRVRAYCTYPTSGLEVSCGLRLAAVGRLVLDGVAVAVVIVACAVVGFDAVVGYGIEAV